MQPRAQEGTRPKRLTSSSSALMEDDCHFRAGERGAEPSFPAQRKDLAGAGVMMPLQRPERVILTDIDETNIATRIETQMGRVFVLLIRTVDLTAFLFKSPSAPSRRRAAF